MKALVTGSNGFIGSHLVEALLQAGFEVACLYRAGSRETFLRGLPITRAHIDYAKPETICKSSALDNAEYVFHAAGVTKRITREQFLRGNVAPTQNLLEALKARALPLRRFVFLSSQAACGPAVSLQQPRTEEDGPEPVEYYGESKRLAEQIVQEYGDAIPFTIIRPGGVYGPRDVDFLNLFKQVARGFNIYAGNRRKYVSVIHVNDLVRGILAAAQSPAAAGGTYHLCDVQPVTWETLQKRIVDAVGKRVITLTIPETVLKLAGVFGDLYGKTTGRFPLLNSQKIKLSLPRYWIMSNQRAARDFGFHPEVSLEEGLRGTLAWYRENGWL